MEKTLYLEEFMYLVMILLHYFPTCETYNVLARMLIFILIITKSLL